MNGNVLPIHEEEPQDEKSRLELFYQEMLQSQMEKKAADPVQAIEKAGHEPSKEKSGDQEQPEDRFLHQQNASEQDPACYSRKGLLSGKMKTDAKKLESPVQKQGEMTEEDKELLQRLRARDAEVRSHELRHVSALGSYAGAVQYTYQIGPDGRAYAIGGSTEVRASGSDDPSASAQRARTLRQAAMAGGDPSAADLSVAAGATQSEQSALSRMRSGE